RAQAVTRPARISICASDTGTSCAGDWTDGYIVFIDNADSDTAVDPDVGEILKYSQKPKGNLEFTVGYGDDGATPTSFFRFTSAVTLARLNNEVLKINSEMVDCK